MKLLEAIVGTCMGFLNDMSDNLISNRIKTIKFKDIKWGKMGSCGECVKNTMIWRGKY